MPEPAGEKGGGEVGPQGRPAFLPEAKHRGVDTGGSPALSGPRGDAEVSLEPPDHARTARRMHRGCSSETLAFFFVPFHIFPRGSVES